MKFSLHLSNVALAVMVSAMLGFFLLVDISLRLTAPASAPAVAPASTAERIVTQELVLTDRQGHVRARLAVDENDAPSLQLLARDGQKRAALRLNQNDVPSLRLYDADGKARSIIGFTLNDMNPAFVQFDENGEGRAINYSTINLANPAFAVADEDTRSSRPYAPMPHRRDPFASYSLGSGSRVELYGSRIQIPNNSALNDAENSDSTEDTDEN